ncbi:MAG: type II toxin-antitoxin system RelE family toxin, partial [Chthoniobacterales bacterium]
GVVIQVIFNEISAAEMAKLPKELQLDLLSEFQFMPEDIEKIESDERFGKVEHDGQKLLRYRAKDYRIYFSKRDEGLQIHRVLHKNTIRDFLFRSNLPMTEEDEALSKAGGFWELIDEVHNKGSQC